MKNWSTDITKFKNRREKRAFELKQLINYGTGGQRLDTHELKQYWELIADDLDPYKRRTLEYYLWGKLSSLPNNLKFSTIFQQTSK